MIPRTPFTSPQYEHDGSAPERHHRDAAAPVTEFPAHVFIGTAQNRQRQILKAFKVKS